MPAKTHHKIMNQSDLFQPFLKWIQDLDKEIQWRQSITLHDLCQDDTKIVALFRANKSVEEAAQELINEISSGTD